jgi:hypothetical protein
MTNKIKKAKLMQFKDLEQFKGEKSNNFMMNYFSLNCPVTPIRRSYDHFKKFLNANYNLDKELTDTATNLYSGGVRMHHHWMQSEEQRNKIPYGKFFEAYKLISEFVTEKESGGRYDYLCS